MSTKKKQAKKKLVEEPSKTTKTIGINVSIDPESVKAVEVAIGSILSAQCDEATKQKALDCLASSTSITNTNISSNSFAMKE
jgi:hypothetical protein